MPLFTEKFDRWRERQKWIPAWLDNRPWKSWFITHTGLTLLVGVLVSLIFSMVASFFTGHLEFSRVGFKTGTRLMVAMYIVREIINARDIQKYGRLDGDIYTYTPNYLDHVMDALVPLLISETINQNLL